MRAITCVAGNAPLDAVVANTLRILDAGGAPDVNVAGGARRPLIEDSRSAAHVHGEDGLGGIELPPSSRIPEAVGAIELLRRTIEASDEPITIVALAPQTNIALLLRAHPHLAPLIERIVFMGGSAGEGNATAVAEFNVWHDPEAAAIVLDSGVSCYMYGLDVFTQVAVPFETASALARSTDSRARVVGHLLGHRVSREPDHHYTGWIGDAGAVCSLVDPGALHTRVLPTRVELGGYSRGQTIVDRRMRVGEDAVHGTVGRWHDVEVALQVDAGRMATLFLDTVAPGR